jgi:hypothetical protein
MSTISPLYKPRKYQLPLLKAFDKGTKRLIHIWHRRCGKDLTDLNIMIAEMAKVKGNYYYILPTYSQAKKVIWEGKTKDGTPFLDFFPKGLIQGEINNSELKIKFKNGSLFQLIGSDNIDSVVGTNPRGCVFSEFPLQDPKAWSYMRPILAENGGWAIFNGTPRGKNHAWQMLQVARDNPLWFWEILTVNDTDAISKEALEEEKKEMPQALFEQEYYCNFIDGASQFFRRIRMNTYEILGYLPEYGDFQIGVDLGKYQDFTVITPFNLNTFQVYPQDRFNQIDWNLQEARIEVAARKYSNARVKIDRTGIGDPVVENLKRRGLNIGEDDAIAFTEVRRMNLLNHLSMLLEQDKIQIPNDEGLINELESFQYSLSDLGKIKVMAPQGMHDDRVMSLALAVDGISNIVPIDMELHSPRYAQREQEGNMYVTDYN